MTTLQIKNPTLFRENIRSKLIEKFAKPNDIDHLFMYNLEIGVFNYTIKDATNQKIIKKWDNPAFTTIYTDRLRTMYSNLKKPEIIKSIKSGELAPKSFAFMTHQEMDPSIWKAMIDKKIKRDASKYSTNVEAMTEMFTCKKCKSKKCTYYELQTRSADEPSTIFITCIDCGKHWKQN
jgi:transcription elongation factor S-II